MWIRKIMRDDFGEALYVYYVQGEDHRLTCETCGQKIPEEIK